MYSETKVLTGITNVTRSMGVLFREKECNLNMVLNYLTLGGAMLQSRRISVNVRLGDTTLLCERQDTARAKIRRLRCALCEAGNWVERVN